jgi:hypothetical protein
MNRRSTVAILSLLVAFSAGALSAYALSRYRTQGAEYSQATQGSLGIALDSIRVTFRPNGQDKDIELVKQAINGTVVPIDKTFNTVVFTIPRRNSESDILKLTVQIEQLPGVEYVNPSTGDPIELRAR